MAPWRAPPIHRLPLDCSAVRAHHPPSVPNCRRNNLRRSSPNLPRGHRLSLGFPSNRRRGSHSTISVCRRSTLTPPSTANLGWLPNLSRDHGLSLGLPCGDQRRKVTPRPMLLPRHSFPRSHGKTSSTSSLNSASSFILGAEIWSLFFVYGCFHTPFIPHMLF